MPVITLYPHGLKGGVAPVENSHQRARRGNVSGWSPGACRRNTEFLMSVLDGELTGVGFALTLTVRDCPPTSDDWHRLRRAWIDRMRRLGMIRLHWVTEWQRRGVPHLHVAIWFPSDAYEQGAASGALRAWVDLAAPYGASLRGQHAALIDGAVGWFRYVSKHASRGVKHYQRSPENIPEGWRRRTGRVWGKSGDWPTAEKRRFRLQDHRGDGGWFAYRRMVRAWRIADARSAGDPIRLRQARAMLRCGDPASSRIRGVMEWIPEQVHMALLANLAGRGFVVFDEATGELL
mgnify:FL=1